MGSTESTASAGSEADRASAQAEANKDRTYLWKVAVVGDVGSGKTSIIRRFVHDQFTNAYIGTEGVDFALKTIYWDQHTTITSQFWDIPGKERYGKMTRVIYQGSVGAVVVTDFTSPDFLKSAEMWVTDIKSKVTLDTNVAMPIILLINKVDLVDQAHKERNQALIAEFAKQHRLVGCWLVSAKENHNIVRPFHVLVEKLLRTRARSPFLRSTEVIPIEDQSQPRPQPDGSRPPLGSIPQSSSSSSVSSSSSSSSSTPSSSSSSSSTPSATLKQTTASTTVASKQTTKPRPNV